VARAFGLREEEGRPIIETLAEHLAAVDALLALDNCEHVVGACARLAEELVKVAPALRVVATSREPLGIPGEVTWRVPSLDDEAAKQLFVERAGQVRPGFSPDNAETEVVAQICRRLDGIPLAIELAAARARMMSPARIAAALDDRFRLLTGGGRTALPRQQTLETSVAWSHDLLDERERALLRRLSVFAGGFTLEAAEKVCAAAPLDEYAVLDLISRLVDKSLVHVDQEADGRYRLLETIRLYSGQRLLDSGESDDIRHRHLSFFVLSAERAAPEIVLADGPAWLHRLEQDHDNLRAAMEWADATGGYEPFLRLTTALTLFFELHGHLAAGGRWFARALTRDDGPSSIRARALWGAAHLALYGDDYDTLARRAPEAMEMAEQVGDDWALSRALNINGLAQAFTDPVAARTVLERSIELGRQHGDPWAVVDGWKMVTVTWLMQDDYDGLAPALAEFRSVAEHLGNRFFIAWYYCTVGWVGMFRGDFALARGALQTALEHDAELGGAATAGFASAFLGGVESLTGEYDAAELRLSRLFERAPAVGDALGAPFAFPSLARLRIGLGAPAEGRALLEALAGLAADHESYGEATRLLGGAAALRRSIGLARWPADQADYDRELARARQAFGDSAFERAWTEGEALSVDDAVAYATRARGERKRPSTGWASLTPTEVEVVKLAAKGLTNPEIGERLFIGRGTVKTHLAHVFAKLGVTTRSELAAEATRRDL
jgi:predicted ATPase/DNA-binding CsgD family transcriptional regulator